MRSSCMTVHSHSQHGIWVAKVSEFYALPASPAACCLLLQYSSFATSTSQYFRMAWCVAFKTQNWGSK